MNQLNSIILEGNVVKKAEFSEPKTGFQVCKFPLAVNRRTKTPEGETKEEVSYFDVETYGEMAESCYKWCDRGQGVRVVGRLKQSRWEENNVKKSKVYVVAEHVEYKFSKPKGEAAKNDSKKEAPAEKESQVEKAAEQTQTAEAVF
jgi:single-strand DNA-binding protein